MFIDNEWREQIDRMVQAVRPTGDHTRGVGAGVWVFGRKQALQQNGFDDFLGFVSRKRLEQVMLKAGVLRIEVRDPGLQTLRDGLGVSRGEDPPRLLDVPALGRLELLEHFDQWRTNELRR